MVKLPANTPEILRKVDLTVVETEGWESRGRPLSTGLFAMVGVTAHHTATSAASTDARVVRLLIEGRPDLAGPLAHFGLARDGTVYVIAAGRANHAGKARPHGSVAGGDGNRLYIGIEAFSDGREPWLPAQYDAYVRLVAALCVYVTGNSVRTVAGHKETSVTGKPDPTFDMGKFRERVAEEMRVMAKGDLPPARGKRKARKAARKRAAELIEQGKPISEIGRKDVARRMRDASRWLIERGGRGSVKAARNIRKGVGRKAETTLSVRWRMRDAVAKVRGKYAPPSRIYTFASANIAARMSASEATDDLGKILKRANIVAVQEFQHGSYWQQARKLFAHTHAVAPFWGEAVKQSILSASAIFARRSDWYISDRRARKLHKGVGGVSHTRMVRSATLTNMRTGDQLDVLTCHFVVHGDKPGAARLRREMLDHDISVLDEEIGRLAASGRPWIAALDANIKPGRTASEVWDRFRGVVTKHGGRFVGERGVEYVIASPEIVADETWTIPAEDLHTDHEARGLTFRIDTNREAAK